MSSVSIRVWSVATTLATSRSLRPGTRDEDGGRLVGEVEGAGDDVAVGADDQAGGRADALADARRCGRPPTISVPPVVSICTTLGATFSAAALIACLAAVVESLRGGLQARPSGQEDAGQRRRSRGAVRHSREHVMESLIARSHAGGSPATKDVGPDVSDGARSLLPSGSPESRRRGLRSRGRSFFVFGSFSSVSVDRHQLVAAADLELDHRPRPRDRPIISLNVVDAHHRLAVDVDDQVVRLQPGLAAGEPGTTSST